MKKQGKVWGWTLELFNKNNVEVHLIRTKKGGFCSKHKHEHKHNMFICLAGLLNIKIWKKSYDLVDETQIGPLQVTSVPPGEYHLFEAKKDSWALEIYWVTLDTDDIQRENVGGK